MKTTHSFSRNIGLSEIGVDLGCIYNVGPRLLCYPHLHAGPNVLSPNKMYTSRHIFCIKDKQLKNNRAGFVRISHLVLCSCCYVSCYAVWCTFAHTIIEVSFILLISSISMYNGLYNHILHGPCE